MLATEAQEYIGHSGLLSVTLTDGELSVPIKVIDAKRAYGRLRLRIQVLSPGKGSLWVSADRVWIDGN